MIGPPQPNEFISELLWVSFALFGHHSIPLCISPRDKITIFVQTFNYLLQVGTGFRWLLDGGGAVKLSPRDVSQTVAEQSSLRKLARSVAQQMYLLYAKQCCNFLI